LAQNFVFVDFFQKWYTGLRSFVDTQITNRQNVDSRIMDTKMYICT
jgi:hypothetical protein